MTTDELLQAIAKHILEGRPIECDISRDDEKSRMTIPVEQFTDPPCYSRRWWRKVLDREITVEFTDNMRKNLGLIEHFAAGGAVEYELASNGWIQWDLPEFRCAPRYWRATR